MSGLFENCVEAVPEVISRKVAYDVTLHALSDVVHCHAYILSASFIPQNMPGASIKVSSLIYCIMGFRIH